MSRHGKEGLRWGYVNFFLRPLTWCNYKLRTAHVFPDKWFWADIAMRDRGYTMGQIKRYEALRRCGGVKLARTLRRLHKGQR